MDGGCCCGNIRYRASGEPVFSVICFCRDCLSAFGCDGYPGMMVRNENFQVLKGTPSTFSRSASSGRTVERNFCSDCGTNLWGQTELGMVSIVAGSLDDPSVFKPTKAVFTSQAPTWARIPTELELE